MQISLHLCVQKPLVSHPYKNLMTFGGCKQDFMLVVGQSSNTNTTKDKPTEKHLFALDASKVCEKSVCGFCLFISTGSPIEIKISLQKRPGQGSSYTKSQHIKHDIQVTIKQNGY